MLPQACVSRVPGKTPGPFASLFISLGVPVRPRCAGHHKKAHLMNRGSGIERLKTRARAYIQRLEQGVTSRVEASHPGNRSSPSYKPIHSQQRHCARVPRGQAISSGPFRASSPATCRQVNTAAGFMRVATCARLGILQPNRVGARYDFAITRRSPWHFFFRRALSLVERFESALEDKQAAREKLADRLSAAETALGEKRAAAERFAMADAADAQLDRAEVAIRAAEDRVKTLKAALAQVDEQIADAERELVDAKAQRARDMTASELEKMAAAIEHAAPRYDAAAIALIEAITKSPASLQEATSFAN